MLRAYSRTSFYIDNYLVDTSWLEWENRTPNGCSNHKRLQAVTKLRMIASELLEGQQYIDEDTIKRWLKEAQ